MCTVPWSEDTASHVESKLKAMLWISACSAPRRSSWRGCPECESHTRIRVPRSEAVASLVPSRLSARQERDDSCAEMRVGRRMSKSSTRRWPFCRPGQASTQVLELGLSAQSPLGLDIVSKWCIRRRSAKLYTYTLYSRATTTRSRRSLTAFTSLRKDSSPMQRFWWSSQIITLLGG